MAALKAVDLPGKIRASGNLNVATVGDFFGWETGYVSKTAANFTREQLLANGWKKSKGIRTYI
jgi:hypothetical protein